MNVSASTANIRSAQATQATQAAQRPDPATAFRQMDSQGKGYVTQEEFSATVVYAPMKR